jgi:hypothetical protein
MNTPSKWALVLVSLAWLAGCATPVPHRTAVAPDATPCTDNAVPPCATRSTEVSIAPDYTLHVVEFDDQGWMHPRPETARAGPAVGEAHGQIDRAMKDLSQRLGADQRVLLMVYVHGWKHSAAHDDRDVMRFRQMLADAARLDVLQSTARGVAKRSVVGIYVGWRGAGGLSASNPLVHLTFWTRKNAALHISEGASRELFSRIRALRERANTAQVGGPKLRTVVVGHSFGAWIVFSAMSPALLEMMARPVDQEPPPAPAAMQEAWHDLRRRQVADIVVLVNPAFEASRYQPLHSLANRVALPQHEAPVLVLVTSMADLATRAAFPAGRFFNTIFQRPFLSDEESRASVRAPGFMEEYRTHSLTRGTDAEPPECAGWKDIPRRDAAVPPGSPAEAARARQVVANARAELMRHVAWEREVERVGGTPANGFSWRYCGSRLDHLGMFSPRTPVWNVVTDKSMVEDHSDIMGESLHAFLRQLYLDLPR